MSLDGDMEEFDGRNNDEDTEQIETTGAVVFDVEQDGLNDDTTLHSDLSSVAESNDNEDPNTNRNFEIALTSIVARHGTSDKELKDWMGLIKASFPDADIPSYSQMKNRHHVPQTQHNSFIKSCCSTGEYWMLDFMNEILQILKANLDVISDYSLTRDSSYDLNLQPCLNFEKKELTISLIMNSDGVRIIKSSPKHLWPVWLALADLPPKLRCSYNNIVLATLWCGVGKPNWDELFTAFEQKLKQQFTVEYKNVNFKIIAQVVLLVADIPATASMLNMHHHLAKFGCTMCLIETETEERVRYFPLKKFPLRTSEIHSSHLQRLREENLSSFMGVKGPSFLFKIIRNLPLSAPPDCMHQVYIGVTKVLLQVILKKTSRIDLECLKLTVSKINLPSDFKRSVRPLNELEFFKANELKTWLLYIGPALFNETINERLASRFCLLSFAVRLLMTSSKHCCYAEKVIEKFLQDTKEDYSEVAFSANVHSLTHLTWQVRNIGPLWTSSGMMFESANYLLNSKFTGTVNHLPLLVERYHRNKEAWRASIKENEPLAAFCLKLRGKKPFKKDILLPSQVPPHLIKQGRSFYRCRKFENFSLEGPPNEKDCFFSAEHNGALICGKVCAFFTEEDNHYVSAQMFKILKSYASPLGTSNNVFSYHIVELYSEWKALNVILVINKMLHF